MAVCPLLVVVIVVVLILVVEIKKKLSKGKVDLRFAVVNNQNKLSYQKGVVLIVKVV